MVQSRLMTRHQVRRLPAGGVTPSDTAVPSARRSRWLSPHHPHWRTPWGVGALALASLLLVLLICEAAGWPFLRGPFERQLEQRLQREVTIGSDFSLRLLGRIRLRTDQFGIGPPAWAEDVGQPTEFLRAEDVYLALPYGTLFDQWRHRGGDAPPIEVRAFEVGRIDAVLWRLDDGRANWQFGAPKPEQAQRGFEAPEFDRLVVGEGSVRFSDAVQSVELQARARTDEGVQARQGARGLVVEGAGSYRTAKFDFRIASSGALPLLASEGDSEPVPIRANASAGQAQYSFEGTATDVLRLHGFDGSFSVQGNSLATAGAPWGVTLPTTPPFKLDGRLAKQGNVWKADVRQAAVGTSRLGGSFTFDRRPQVPVLSGELTGERLVLADLGPAFGARRGGREPREDRDASGQVLPQREFNIPSLRAMNADVRVDLKMLDLGTAYLRDLRPVQAHLRLQGGMLRIQDVLVSTSGGELRGALLLDSRPAVPRWDLDVHLARVRLEQWLQARNPRDERAKEGAAAPAYVTGLLSGRAKFQGVGRSTAAMLGSLDGSASLWVNDGQLSHLVVEALGIDVAEGLGLLIGGDRQLPMNCAVVRFAAHEGQLKSELGLIDTPDTTVLVNGTVSLAREQLDLQLTARPKDFSPLSLRSPIQVQGSFADPQVRLDAGRIGLKVLAAAALAAVNPLAAVIPLIDPGEQQKSGCRQALDRLRSARAGEPVPGSDGARR
jgi:uncharacterized protein involved in outer membrane biogenesis